MIFAPTVPRMKNISSLEPDSFSYPTTTSTSCDVELNAATIASAGPPSNGVYIVEDKQNKNTGTIRKCYCRLRKTHVWHTLALAVIWILHTIPIIVYYAVDAGGVSVWL